MTSLRSLLATDLRISRMKSEWGMDRNDGIGGSEAGSLLGLNKYKSPEELLEEKITRTSNVVFTPDQQLRMDCGHSLESLTLATFAEQTLGVPYVDAEINLLNLGDGLAHPSQFLFINSNFPFAFAHIDGLYRIGDTVGIADAKVSFRDPWPEVPEYYIAQLAHYGAVLGITESWIAAMFMTNPYPVPGRYQFHISQHNLDLVMQAEGLFWGIVDAHRNGNPLSEGQKRSILDRCRSIGDEFLSSVYADNPAEVLDSNAVTYVVDPEDVAMIIKYKELKKKVGEFSEEVSAIKEYLDTTYGAMDAILVDANGIEVAKRKSYVQKRIDTDSMVEVGFPVEHFYKEQKYSRLTISKQLPAPIVGSPALTIEAEQLSPEAVAAIDNETDSLIANFLATAKEPEVQPTDGQGTDGQGTDGEIIQPRVRRTRSKTRSL